MLNPLARLWRGEAPPSSTETLPDVATSDDIAACFRLLLGRPPNAEELRGHLAQVGHPLHAVVSGYLSSLEFTRRGLLRSTETLPTLAQCEGFSLYAREEDAAVGHHVLHGVYEPEVAAMFRRVLRPGMGVVDVGANIGYLTMLSAALVGPAGAVLAIEPNGANARLLEASRRTNGFEHVTVAQIAAGRRTGLLALNSTHSNGTTSDPSGDIEALLAAHTVPCVPIDSLVPADADVHLLKLDVEGAEYNALLGASGLLARQRPAIISEFSPSLMPGISGIDGPGYLRWLHARDYTISVIQPGGGLLPAAQDVGLVMDAFARHGADHIDLYAEPIG